MAKILFVTDVHGNESTYEKLLKRGKEKDIDAVVIGGDICPGFEIDEQRAFLQTWLVPKLADFKKTKKDVFIMMGNDDFSVNMDVLLKGEKDGLLKIMHNRAFKLKKFHIIGCSYINPSPFFIKDWERDETTIKKHLWKMGKTSEMKKLIFVFHAPPHNTKLDLIYNGDHVGSTAVREFIEEFQPFMTLHGHIHESRQMSNSYVERVKKTICINPGNGRPAVIDLDNPEASEFLE